MNNPNKEAFENAARRTYRLDTIGDEYFHADTRYAYDLWQACTRYYAEKIAELEEKANEDFHRYKQELSSIYAALDDERVDLVITAVEAILELKAKLKAAEAKIDALLLEYCPSEMSAEQVTDWAQHQKAVETP